MPAQAYNKNEGIELFPVPVPLQSTNLPVPRPLPGITPASTAALREVLHANNRQFHCFFNDKGFHKCVYMFICVWYRHKTLLSHTAHTAIALWYLGADPNVIKAAFASQSSYQRPTLDSPGPINKDNWTQHLGDDKLVFWWHSSYICSPSLTDITMLTSPFLLVNWKPRTIVPSLRSMYSQTLQTYQMENIK